MVLPMKTIVQLLTLTLVSMLILAACSTRPAQEELAAADYGRVPTANIYEPAVKSALQLILKDPFSAQYKFGSLISHGFISKVAHG
jgi:hypothetical protein